MTNYYIEKDNKIIFVDTDLQRLQNTVTLDEYSNLEIKETERTIENFEFADTLEYAAEQKKQLIQSAKAIRDTAINEITNAKLLDDLQLDAGQITQVIYDARKTARLAQLAEVQTTFYTTTGLTQPTIITA